MRWLWKGYHWYYFIRALLRGPRYFAGYEVRRQTRRAAWRATRRWK